MLEHNDSKLIRMPAATTATNATQTMVFDTVGEAGEKYNYANLYVMCDTHATNGASIGTLAIKESDSSTAVSSHSAIVAFTGGTATSTSVGYVIPGASTLGAGGGVIEFQVDLRKRKRYLSLNVTPGSTTFQISALALLSRGSESADSTTEKRSVNYAVNTNKIGVKVVNG